MKQIKHIQRYCTLGLSDIGRGLNAATGAGAIQEDAQAFSAEEALRQRKWSRKNYRKRFQWSAQDMKAAGINPILAAGMGLGGGGTPSGAAASGSTVTPGASGAGQLINSALGVRKLMSEIKLLNAQEAERTAQAGKATKETIGADQWNKLKAPVSDTVDWLKRQWGDMTSGIDLNSGKWWNKKLQKGISSAKAYALGDKKADGTTTTTTVDSTRAKQKSGGSQAAEWYTWYSQGAGK